MNKLVFFKKKKKSKQTEHLEKLVGSHNSCTIILQNFIFSHRQLRMHTEINYLYAIMLEDNPENSRRRQPWHF